MTRESQLVQSPSVSIPGAATPMPRRGEAKKAKAEQNTVHLACVVMWAADPPELCVMLDRVGLVWLWLWLCFSVPAGEEWAIMNGEGMEMIYVCKYILCCTVVRMVLY